MAASKVVSRLQPLALKITKRSLSFEFSPLKSSPPSQLSAFARRLSHTSRLPVELSSLGSMMPLYNAVASARLVSSLSVESRAWGLVPQGISMPL
ncbi:hypothetical protein L6164_007954 [Bauhinia variegata]|uniref:Uncharacterized protein n=1 Tax=Bauhinia variegata TaxID=167791 RepID=A0ACB9PFH6_BAUVA|nr:hypothetical protein L6164_007954 [Bauhinia variegata]